MTPVGREGEAGLQDCREVSWAAELQSLRVRLQQQWQKVVDRGGGGLQVDSKWTASVQRVDSECR